MIRRAGILLLGSVFLYGLTGLRGLAQEEPAQEVSAQEEPAQEVPAQEETPGHKENAGKRLLAEPGEEKVVLSPWRVGDVKTEKRKRELESRHTKVLRKAEEKKRDVERRKKRARERAARLKEQPDSFFPTNY